MSTARINAIDARINERGYLEVGDTISRNVEVGDEYISIPLEGKWKTRTAKKNVVKEDKPKGKSGRPKTEKTTTTKTAKNTTTKKNTTAAKKTATQKTTTSTKTAEQAPKRKPGRPRKVQPEEEMER